VSFLVCAGSVEAAVALRSTPPHHAGLVILFDAAVQQ